MRSTLAAALTLGLAAATTLAAAESALDHDLDTRPPWHAHEADASLVAAHGTLLGAGYRGIMEVSGDPYRLLALDRWGSEVAIRIDPGTGEINGIHIVHPTDR